MPGSRAAADERRKIRYAVAGLGHIAQAAVLPAFAHAGENSELAALVSGDAGKLAKLGRKYRVRHRYAYDQFEECLTAAEIDAVYIALPNELHREYAVRAAEAGVHVLCEKPLAPTEADCQAMIDAADRNGVKLMTAYRLHFDEANLSAVDAVQSGRLGDVKLFNSTFTMQVKPGDIRLNPRSKGGGSLYDIGVYCINAARYFYAAEPEWAFATATEGSDPRFADTEESVSAVLRFPGERLASFVVSFGAASVSTYTVVGTRGSLVMDPAYAYADAITQTVTVNGRSRARTFPKHDQFAPELVSFSECIITGEEPEPSGREGLADVRVIRALYRSIETGRPVELGPFRKDARPTIDQAIRKPSVREPKLVNTEAPSE